MFPKTIYRVPILNFQFNSCRFTKTCDELLSIKLYLKDIREIEGNTLETRKNTFR